MTDLLALMQQLSGIAPGLAWTALMVFLRIGAAMALLPAFGEQVIPVRVRLAVTLALTVVVAPGIVAPPPPGMPAAGAEVVAGLLLGAGLRLIVMALQVAGTIAAQASSLSQLFGGAGPEPQPAMGNLLVMAGLALALAAGLHIRLVAFFLMSYDLLPAGRLPGADAVAAWGLARIGHSFALGFSLALPFVIAATLFNLATGFINRAMPQLMVALVGAPALGLGGLALLMLVAPVMLALWMAALSGALANPLGLSP